MEEGKEMIKGAIYIIPCDRAERMFYEMICSIKNNDRNMINLTYCTILGELLDTAKGLVTGSTETFDYDVVYHETIYSHFGNTLEQRHLNNLYGVLKPIINNFVHTVIEHNLTSYLLYIDTANGNDIHITTYASKI